jgi:hypothetical protein
MTTLTAPSETFSQYWHRMLEQLTSLTQSLEAADIPYTLIQNRAVDYWYSTVGEEPYHTYGRCELLVRRLDISRLMPVLQNLPWKVTTKRKAVLVHKDDDYRNYTYCFLFTGENLRKEELLPYPSLRNLVRSPRGWVIGLESLVGMLLARLYTIDKCHLFSMFEYGLITQDWRERLPACLQDRFDMTYAAFLTDDDIKRGLRYAS